MKDARERAANDDDDLPALIERIYSTVLEPERYDELMAEWEVHVTDALRALEAGDIERAHPPAEQGVAPHVSNAIAMFDRLGRPDSAIGGGEDLLEREPGASVLIEATGLIAQVNSKALHYFGIEAGSHLSQLPIEADGLAKFEAALLHAEKQACGRLLAIASAYGEDDEQPFVVALTRLPMASSEPPLFKLSSVNVVWSEHIGMLLRASFGLTQAEYEITRLLIEGKTTDAIAQARRSTIGTTRTQIKSILQKTRTRSQAALVRMVAALSAFAEDDTVKKPARRARAHVDRFMVSREGRRLQVSLIGAQDGRPVLYLHGMIDGHSAPLFNRAALAERGIKLIVPARPGFGASEPYSSPKQAPERLAGDIEAVLDHCGVASCPVVGHFGGALYAYAAAAVLGPDRISHVLNVSGVVPMTTAEHFSSLAPRQRVLAYTGRYAPGLLPVLARGAVALLDKGGHEKFMEMAYASQHADWLVARRDTVFPVLCEGYDFMAAQGASGLEIDAFSVVRKDWTRYADLCSQPVTLLHGEHDPAVPLWSVREFAAGRSNTSLHEIPHCGQLIFYAFPERVLGILETTLDTGQ